jgi:hypothetical protein
METMKMPKKIFISHTTADDAFVTELRKALENQGFLVWVDSQSLRGGDTLKTEIETAIKDAAAFIVVISPRVFASHWVRQEVLFAQEVLGPKKLPIFAILFDNIQTDSLLYYFREEPVAISIKNSLWEAMPKILSALGKELPTDFEPEITIKNDPLEELVLKLTKPQMQVTDEKNRAIATAQLIFKSSNTSNHESKPFPFTATGAN